LYPDWCPSNITTTPPSQYVHSVYNITFRRTDRRPPLYRRPAVMMITIIIIIII
jgi:hypothetical protein